VNAVVRELPVPQLVVHDASLELAAGSAASPVTAALAQVAAEAQQLLTGGSLLRACHAPGCVLYFARTHPRREWCSVACGNRVRAARHYRTVRSARPTRDPL
jgi:predicted RNA-binding Zn ribbon-like protein